MKRIFAATVMLLASVGWSQSDRAARNSDDAKMAPRSLLIEGGPLDSARGLYVISFPPPNDCVQLTPIRARSRPMALYTAVSRGGFTLLPSQAGLTVWTIEEWEALKKEFPKFETEMKEHCQSTAK